MRSRNQPVDPIARCLLGFVLVCCVLGPWKPVAAEGDDLARCARAGLFQLCVEKSFPREGDPCRVWVTEGGSPVEGAEIVVTYRPNSEVTTIETIGTTDDSGQLVWMPSDAGIATLEAEGEEIDPLSLTLSVRFRSPPTLGIIMLIVAGMILFGGNGYAFAKTFARKL